MLTKRTPEAAAWAREEFAAMRSEGVFTPLAVDQKTIVLPGYDGGAEWGGQGYDARTGVLYLNSNDVPWTGELRAPRAHASAGGQVYAAHCVICHGENLEGDPPTFPSLIGLTARSTPEVVAAVIRNGRGRMVGFPALEDDELDDLITFLMEGEADKVEAGTAPASEDGPAYVFTGYHKFRDPDGYPAIEPPWGTLNAIDLNTGEYVWRRPLGVYPELVEAGHPPTGSENYGGPVVTASGLIFIGATIYDRRFRAISAETGESLWETELPYAGAATPITYAIDGRQYVAIAASGRRDRDGPQGAAYVAFALPSGAK